MWTVKPGADGNVHTIKFKYTSDSDFSQYVLLTSDVHFDNAKCDRKLFLKHCELAKERGAPIIVIGDVLDLMQSKTDRRQSKKALRDEHKREDYLDAVIEETTEKLSPYPFAVISEGNHETAITNRLGTNMIKRLARELGCHAGGYRGFINFAFEKVLENSSGSRQTIKMFYDHGSGGGGPVTKGTIKSARRSDMVDGVDIIASGHIHEAWVLERLKFTERSGKIYHRTVFHVQCPTYKEEIGSGASGWANENSFPPKPLGGWWINFSLEKKRIKIRLERAD